MEVVCLTLGPMLTSRPCSLLFGFWSSFIFVFYYSCFHCFWMVDNLWILFVDSRNTGLRDIYIYHTIIIALTPQCLQHSYIIGTMMKLEGQSLSIIYESIIILLHLKMMPIFYFPYSIVCNPTRSRVNHVGLYWSGLSNFGSYINLPNMFAYFLGFDIQHLRPFLLKMLFIVLELLEGWCHIFVTFDPFTVWSVFLALRCIPNVCN